MSGQTPNPQNKVNNGENFPEADVKADYYINNLQENFHPVNMIGLSYFTPEIYLFLGFFIFSRQFPQEHRIFLTLQPILSGVCLPGNL